MRYAFGHCELDTARRELRRDGRVVPLEPKGYRVLLHLIEHRDRVTTREELLDHAWPGVCVVDTTVSRCITLIRQAIGDTAAAQRLIKTLHRQGYRFVAPVSDLDDRAPESGPPPASPAPWHAHERRHLTVLAGAMAPNVTLLPSLDAETLQGLLGELAQRVRDAVAPFDGHVLAMTADRLCIVFGAPVALEDHAERASLAALALAAPWAAWNAAASRHTGTPVSLGLGLHSGAAVVSPGASPGSITLAGDVVAIAERLAARADDGTVLASAAAAQAAQAVVRSTPAATLEMAERRQAVTAHRIDAVLAPPALGAALGVRHRGPFVGRRDDLAALRMQLERVREGHGRSLAIVGPPGMGKTRLAAEFVRGIDRHACEVVYGRCQSHGRGIAGLPLADLLQRWWRLDEAADPAQRRARAEAALRGSSAPALPLLRLLRLADADAGIGGAADAAEPAERRAQTFAALHALFFEASERRPLMIVIEDLHWIDDTSKAYLSALAARMASRRILLLQTLRPGQPPPWHALSLHGQLALAPLAEPDSRALVRATRRGTPLQAALEARIVARSQGVPFFVEALTQAVGDGPEPQPASEVPESIQSTLAARIDRLPAAAKQMLQAAAVIGADVPQSLLRGLCALPQADADQALAALEASELLLESRAGPDPVHAFQHALVMEVAYEMLLRAQRRELHRRVVALMEEQVADAFEPLAHHAMLGELWPQAEANARLAGMRAFARGSNAEAVAFLEQALEANARGPADRAAVERAVDLRLALRSALLPSGDFARTLACVQEAERLADALGDPRRLAQTACFLSLHLYIDGRHAEAVQAGRRAQALTAGSDPVVQAIATYLVGIPLQAQGLHAQAIDCFDESLAVLGGELRHRFFSLAILPSVTSCAFLASSCAELGRFDEAQQHAVRGLEIAESAGHPPSVMFAAWGAGWAAFRRGDTARAVALLERGLSICRDVGLVLHFPMVAVPLGGSYLQAGRVDEAVALLSRTHERVAAHRMVNFEGVCRLTLAEALLAAGRTEDADAQAQAALAWVRRQGERGYEGYALLAQGRIALRRGDAATALAAAGQAQTLAAALGMAPLQAQARALAAEAETGALKKT